MGQQHAAGSPLRRWLPAAVLAVLVALAFATGLHHHLSLSSLAAHREELKQLVAAHSVLAVAVFMGIYIAVVALSIPGAAVLSIAGGFLFGWLVSVPATVIAAVIGATIVYEIVKSSLGAALAERAGPLVQKLSRGFAENAFSLLLFLRLAPVFPFCAVNAVSGLCRVPRRTFVVATVIGIIPASIAFALLGTGLDDVIDRQTALYRACVAEKGDAGCSLSLDPSALLTPNILIAFGALGVVALIPLAARLWKRQHP